MRRPEEIRSSPKDWVNVLLVAYPFLVGRGIGNLLLYGSQATSFYMKSGLRSKDLDLVTDQLRPRHLDELARALRELPNVEVRSTTVQTRIFNGRMMRTYSVEMRIRTRPFFVEIFDAVLDGQSPAILTPHVRSGKRWGLRLWVPTQNAIVALRLCFRQPEGISRLNAIRLNRFIKENRKHISSRKIGRMILEWGMGDVVIRNLSGLKRRHRLGIIGQDEIVRTIQSGS